MGDYPIVNLGYSESPFFAAPVPDATTDRKERDLPLAFPFGNKTGHICVEKEFIRGGFKYLTIQLPYSFRYDQSKSQFWDAIDGIANAGQRVLGLEPKPLSSVLRPGSSTYRRPFVALRNIWVNCTAFPSQTNGRAYSGYFSSSSPLLNRIWYAGAWTLQLSTIDPVEGSALIDYNRAIDGNKSPTGSWYSNFTISNGSAVTTDGAKRDRVVWPGDMYIAVPGIAVSTYDMLAVRNALDVLFDHQYEDGSLPYAGPPLGFRGEFSDTYHLHTLLGVFNYVLYSGDVAWLESRWPAYLRALEVSMAKVDELGLLHVSSTADWLRPGMTGHNLEASAMLFEVLRRTFQLVEFLGSDWVVAEHVRAATKKSWETMQRTLEKGLTRLYCADSGMYADNVGRRGCAGPERCEAQDGNSWALISRMALLNGDSPTARTAYNVSENLRARWTKYGAPAVEFPNTISPFASGFELLAHCAAGNVDAAVELMLLEWGYLLNGPGFTNSTLAEGFRIDGYVQYPAYWSAARNSHAHGWASGPTGVLVTEVLGIELQGPAGSSFVIHPELTRWLGWVTGGFATTKGKFEVTMSRAIEVDEEGRKGAKGQLVVITTPPGTSGTIRLGHGSFEHEVEMQTVERTRAWFVKDDKVVLPLNDGTVSMLVGGDNLQNFRNRISWAQLPESPSERGWRLKYDDSFTKPKIEDRPVGVIDWDALEKNYAPSLWDMDWKIQGSEE